MKRSNLNLLLSLALVFVSGVVVGGVAGKYYFSQAASAKAGPPRSPEDFRRVYMAELNTRLKLTPEQYKQVEVILDETRAKFMELREKHRPEMDAIHARQVDEMNAILSSEQQAEYAKMRKEREDRAKAEGKDRGPKGPHPPK
jgi:hypothetical protein